MVTRQIARKPRKKHGRRRAPNGSEKLAAALLKIRMGVEGGNWLIPEPLRSEGTAAEICAAVDFDHAHRFAEGGSLDPRNLFPMMRADHREKSRTDTTEIAKGKRYGAKETAFRERLLAKHSGEVFRDPPKNPKPKIKSRPFLTPEERRAIKARTVRNSRTVEQHNGPAERRT